MLTFFISLPLVAAGQKPRPRVQVFGADQLDGENPNESKTRSCFFLTGGVLAVFWGLQSHAMFKKTLAGSLDLKFRASSWW